MQRQAVPLLITDSPYIGTGMERKAARDSGAVVVAKRSGVVKYVDSTQILVKPDTKIKEDELGFYDRVSYRSGRLRSRDFADLLDKSPLRYEPRRFCNSHLNVVEPGA